MGTTGKHKPYSELGKLLDTLARERAVREPYNIAYHLEEEMGYKVSGQGMSKYMYGHSLPKPKFLEVFAEAFQLSVQERMGLAWAYAYGSRLDLSMLVDGQSKARERALHIFS
jgi:hypothetical protein